jgi:hypothetical protein
MYYLLKSHKSTTLNKLINPKIFNIIYKNNDIDKINDYIKTNNININVYSNIINMYGYNFTYDKNIKYYF